MSKKYVGANKASSTVAANFNDTATAITLATGEGARFPAPTGGDYTLLVLQNTAGVREIICCVGRTADVLTVGIPGSAAANVAGRNYEAIYGMAAASWVIGDVVSCRPTAELIEAGVNFGASIAAAASKATPVDADVLALSDSASANASSKLTWASIKATLKTYFDTLYFAVTGGTLTGDLTMAAGTKIIFEGTTDDAYETTLTAGDPTADRTVTLPNETCELGFRNIPQNAQNAGYTCVLSDAGKGIYMSTSGAFTIPANASVAYPINTAITFVNFSGGVCTIPITSDALYLAGVGTTGTRTLANYGVATALKITATLWVISGAGLT